jgi:hypothetical protein
MSGEMIRWYSETVELFAMATDPSCAPWGEASPAPRHTEQESLLDELQGAASRTLQH